MLALLWLTGQAQVRQFLKAAQENALDTSLNMKRARLFRKKSFLSFFKGDWKLSWLNQPEFLAPGK